MRTHLLFGCVQDIRTAIYNANGTRPSLFVPEMSFDLLVRKQIARLEQPGLQVRLTNTRLKRDIEAQCSKLAQTAAQGLTIFVC